MRLTWRKCPNRGSFMLEPDGAKLHVDGVYVGSASPLMQGRGVVAGWMWSTPSNVSLRVEHRNTAHEPVASIDEAKSQCEAYIRKCLGMETRKKS